MHKIGSFCQKCPKSAPFFCKVISIFKMKSKAPFTTEQCCQLYKILEGKITSTIYRLVQPNLEYTMFKFQDFSVLRFYVKSIVNFEAPKSVIFTFWAALNFEFLGTFDTFNYQEWTFSNNQNSKTSKFLTIWNLPKLILRKIRLASINVANFPHCGISTVKIPN